MAQDPQTLARLRAALADLRVDEMLASVGELRTTATDPAEHALLDAWTAVALIADGKLPEAEAMARSAVGRGLEAGDRAAIYAARYAQVQALVALDRLAEARDVLALQSASTDPVATPRNAAQTELLAVRLALRARDTDGARTHAEEAERLSASVGDEVGIVRARQLAAVVHLARGEVDAATAICDGLADRAAVVGDRQAVVRIRVAESEAWLRTGSPGLALDQARAALAALPDDGLPGLRAEAWNAVGHALRATGQLAAAADAHHRAEQAPEVETRDQALAGLAIGAFLAWDEVEAGQLANRLFSRTHAGTARRDLATALRLAVAARAGDRPVWDRVAGLLAVPLGDPPLPETWGILEKAAVAWERHGGPGDLARAVRAVEGSNDRGGTGLIGRLRARGAPIPAGRWDLERPLGQGGMAQVWLASHHDHRQRAAVKLVTDMGGPGRKRIASLFDAEMRAAASLDHPNVVRVLDHGITGATTAEATDGAIPVGTPWFAMPVADGGSLEELCGRLSWAEVRQALAAVLAGLGHAHARGVLHLDVKPGNVLVHGSRAFLLTDFGLAGIVGLARGRPTRVGTPQSMAPEQFAGDPSLLGPWTDLYGLGCLAVSLVTGRPPFPETSTAELELAHRDREPDVAPVIPVPDGFETWVRCLLAKDPGARFPSAAHAQSSLATLGGAAEPSGPVWFPRPSDAPTVITPLVRVTPSAPRQVVSRHDAVPLPEEPPDTLPAPASLPGMVGLRRPPLVGAATERRRAWTALRRAVDGPVWVVANGDAGPGALVTWLVEQAEVRGGFRTIHGIASLERALGTDLGFPDGIEPVAHRLEALSDERPLALALEDEPATRALADRLLDGSARVLVALAVTGPVTAHPETVVIPWSRRPAAEIEAHLEAMLPLRPELRADLARRSGGSAPFATALLVDLSDRNALERDGSDRFGLRPGEVVHTPGDVRALWTERVDRALAPFSVDAHDLLVAAVLLGPSVARRTIGALARELLLDALRVVLRLRAAGICTSDPDGELTFGDPTLADALVERARVIGRLARCAQLASSVPGVELGAERRGRLLLDADRPIDAAGPLADAVKARIVAGDIEGATALLDLRTRKLGAAGVGPESTLWIADSGLRSRLALLGGRIAEARSLAESAVAAARSHGAPDLLSVALEARAMVVRSARSGDPVPDLLEASGLYAEIGDAEGEANTLVHLAAIRALPEPDVAIAHLARVDAIGPSDLIRARARVVRARLLSDPADGARELALAIEGFERIGRWLAASECEIDRVRLLRIAGEASSLLEAAVRLRCRRLTPQQAFRLAVQVALLHLARGDLVALDREMGAMRADFPELDRSVATWTTVLATPWRLADHAPAWRAHLSELAVIVAEVPDAAWALAESARIALSRGLPERAAALHAIAVDRPERQVDPRHADRG